MNVTELYISISGDDFNPDVITTTLNIFPTSSHKKGDALKFNKKADFSQWCLSTGKIESDNPDFYELSASLVGKLNNKLDYILALKKEYELNITLQAAITYDKDACSPIMGFDKETVKFLSKIDAVIDIDIY